MANVEWEQSLLFMYESGYEFWELEGRNRTFYLRLLKMNNNISEFIFIFSNDRDILITVVQSKTFYLQITVQC